MNKVTVIGAGLAGCEAALALAKHNIQVDLIDIKPKNFTPAHKNPNFAELVCSNSLKSQRLETASGLLKEEMKILNSVVIEAAEATKVPAGDALAVERNSFSEYISNKIRHNKSINIITKEITEIPQDTGFYVIATGPLTSNNLAKNIEVFFGSENLNFFDAAAPIVDGESLDYNKVFWASRYGRGGADYLNSCLTKAEYERFYSELINAETVKLKDFEQTEFKVFSGCMPIETIAKGGYDSLRFGPLKPVGILDHNSKKRPFAVVQLRKENKDGTLFNLVGFQTNLKWNEQKRVFRLIPGLEEAEFMRYGVMHRNTFINSPRLLDNCLRSRKHKNLFFAGQLTGVEGYLESAASGLFVGLNLARMLCGKKLQPLEPCSMIGALANYISCEANANNFQPMNSNMGILPPLAERVKNKQERYKQLANLAIDAVKRWRNNEI